MTQAQVVVAVEGLLETLPRFLGFFFETRVEGGMERPAAQPEHGEHYGVPVLVPLFKAHGAEDLVLGADVGQQVLHVRQSDGDGVSVSVEHHRG